MYQGGDGTGEVEHAPNNLFGSTGCWWLAICIVTLAESRDVPLLLVGSSANMGTFMLLRTLSQGTLVVGLDKSGRK